MLCEDFSEVVRQLQLLFGECSQMLQHAAPPTSRARLIKRGVAPQSRADPVASSVRLLYLRRASISIELSRRLETVPHKVASPQIQRLAAIIGGAELPSLNSSSSSPYRRVCEPPRLAPR